MDSGLFWGGVECRKWGGVSARIGEQKCLAIRVRSYYHNEALILIGFTQKSI